MTDDRTERERGQATREMSLAEYVGRLPEPHRARREYAALLAERTGEQYEGLAKRLDHRALIAEEEGVYTEANTYREAAAALRSIGGSEQLAPEFFAVEYPHEEYGWAWSGWPTLEYAEAKERAAGIAGARIVALYRGDDRTGERALKVARPQPRPRGRSRTRLSRVTDR